MNTYGQQRYLENMSNMGSGLSHQSNLSHHSAGSQRGKRILDSERCPKTGEVYSGFNVDTGEIVCNRCIFEQKLKNVKFIAQVSKEQNMKFNQTYMDYTGNLRTLSKINPDVVQQDSEAIVREFFTRLKKAISGLKDQILLCVQNSDSLRELEKILDSSHELVSVGGNTGRQDQFEKEKASFDQKISSGRYASIVKAQDYWQGLFDSLESNSEKMTSTIQASTTQIQKVLRLEADDNFIDEQLAAITKDCLQIDAHTDASSAEASPALSQSVDEDTQRQREFLAQRQREAQAEAQREAQLESERQALIEQEAIAKREAEKREAEAERREAEKREAERAEAEEQQRREKEQAEHRQRMLDAEHQKHEVERIQRLRREAELQEAARREEVNQEERESHSHQSQYSEHSPSNRSSPSKPERPASDSEEEDIGSPPARPTLARPQPMEPFQEPTQPPNIPPDTLASFHRFVELKRNDHHQKQLLLRKQTMEYNAVVQKYNEDYAAYNARKQEAEKRKEERRLQKERDRRRTEQAAQEEALRQREEQARLEEEKVRQQQREEALTLENARIEEERRIQRERLEQEARAEAERQRLEAAAVPDCPEFRYQRLYKMKNDKVYRLERNDENWRQVFEMRGVFMAKITFNLAGDGIYIIGGALDQRSRDTLHDVRLFKPEQNYAKFLMAPMIDSRASFGCFFKNRGKAEIIVAGGYNLGSLSKKTEIFDVAANKWHPLPDMNIPKASCSLCMMNDRLLYCFGGLTRDENHQAQLSDHIEVLNFQNPERWFQLPIQLPKSGCDMGCLPINDSTIILFGGWNRNSFGEAYLFSIARDARGKPLHSMNEIFEGNLQHQDFFLASGAALREGDCIILGGHSKNHKFNLRSKRFVEN